MRKLLSVIVSLMTAMTFAQQPVELPLWPDGAPNSNGLTGGEKEVSPHRISNVTDPTITVYRAPQPNGMAVIMCPGGGYSRLAMDHEGHDMASWFCGQGITYVVLKYRMPNGHCEVPLSDAERAIRIVREHAGEWNIHPRKIGIMGASAGGHLASTLATHYSAASRPDFQILLYPVISMTDQLTHLPSRCRMLGENIPEAEKKALSLELHVTKETSSAFIVLAEDDQTVSPLNSLAYYTALLKHGVSAELHIYPQGGHSFGFCDSFIYKNLWTNELSQWLNAL